NYINRRLCSSGRKVLGIETSCDDTGAAVVDEFGNILGEEKISQNDIHIRNGGIIPPIARNLHQQNIRQVVDTALQQSGCKLEDLSGIAATVRPGLSLSLLVGCNYAKELVQLSQKPFLPIHHMEAHALTVRIVHPVEFPFTVLLASGGHCQLAFVKSVTDFQLLGHCLDNAPGEAIDKFARRLKLKNIAEFRTMSGGQAVETLASRSGNQLAYEYPLTLKHSPDCNFSFSGILFNGLRHIQDSERKLGILGDEMLPDLEDMCASYLRAVTQHIVKRVQRGLTFLDRTEMAPTSQSQRFLVLSGGVACNRYIRAALAYMAEQMEYQFFAPPPHLCTDNGTMVAWYVPLPSSIYHRFYLHKSGNYLNRIWNEIHYKVVLLFLINKLVHTMTS
ncbi:OSGEPL1, partial [Cordylochernes scorpioides]